MMTSLLEVKDLCLDYGAVRALNHVSLKVEENEIVAVLGANGAGKTSLLKAISGLVRPSEGSIHFKGDDLSRIQACSLASRGIAHVPEGRRVFSTLSVRENLLLGKYGVRNSREKADLDSLEERVYALFPILKDRRRQLAGTLSGGEQQMLAIGRALVSSPSLLLLDEPSWASPHHRTGNIRPHKKNPRGRKGRDTPGGAEREKGLESRIPGLYPRAGEDGGLRVLGRPGPGSQGAGGLSGNQGLPRPKRNPHIRKLCCSQKQ